MPTNAWNSASASLAAPVKVFTLATVTVAGADSTAINVEGFTWVDWLVYFSAGAGLTKVTFIPYTIYDGFAVAGTKQMRIPYEPAVAGTGTTVVYPYAWEYTIGPATTAYMCFRTPVVGRNMQCNFDPDAGTIDLEVFALPRTA